jgi:hypothetical protein
VEGQLKITLAGAIFEVSDFLQAASLYRDYVLIRAVLCPPNNLILKTDPEVDEIVAISRNADN